MIENLDKIKRIIDGATDDEILKQAISDLVKVPSEESIFILKGMATGGENSSIRYYARKALDYLEKNSEDKRTFRDFIDCDFKLLVKNLDSPDSSVRLNAAVAAFDANEDKLLPFCAERIKKEGDPFVIASLVKCIGKYGNKKIIPVIEPYLKSADSRIQANTIEALEMIGDISVYPLIIPLLQDVDNRVRANAIKALKNCIQVNVIDVLNEMAGSMEVWMRDSAAYALGEINNDASVKLLKKLLKDKSRNVRNTAHEALKKLSENGSLQAESVLESIDELEGIEDIEDILDSLESL